MLRLVCPSWVHRAHRWCVWFDISKQGEAMRSISGAAFFLAMMACSVSAVAQTASFKCAAPGTVIEYSDGSLTTWLGQVGSACPLQRKGADGRESRQMFFAPAASPPERISSAWAEQVKPSTLWPLAVGKTTRARYEGEGGTPGYLSRWDMRWTVEKFEKVMTKAGTFDAFLVIWQSDQLPPSNWKSTLRLWYASDPGIVVKWEYTDNQSQSSSKSSAEAVSIRRQ